MHVLILGGTGVISTGITRQLLERGDTVAHLNRGRSSAEFAGTVDLIEGTRQSPADLARAAASHFDAVIDMICYTAQDAALAIDSFFGRTPHMLVCSTIDVYTAPAATYPIDETHPREPSSEFAYAYQKVQVEDAFRDAEARDAFAVTILRPAATYVRGVVPPIGDMALYLHLLRAGRPLIMQGDGNTIWVATHRDDVAQGFLGALDCLVARGRAYNLASHEWITWESHWKLAAEAIGAPPPHFVHVPTDVLVAMEPQIAERCGLDFQHHNLVDSHAAMRDLGFAPKIGWAQGARALADLTTPPNPELLARYDALLASWIDTVATLTGAVR